MGRIIGRFGTGREICLVVLIQRPVGRKNVVLDRLFLVEVARDADFVVEPRTLNVTATTISWPEALPKGKWFWRVTGVNGDGFSGASSKVYAFTVAK